MFHYVEIFKLNKPKQNSYQKCKDPSLHLSNVLDGIAGLYNTELCMYTFEYVYWTLKLMPDNEPLIFQIVGLYHDPDGKVIFESVTSGFGKSLDQSKQLSQSQPNSVSTVQSGRDLGMVASLQRRVKELEAIVAQYQVCERPPSPDHDFVILVMQLNN